MTTLTPAPIAPSTLRPGPFPQEMDAFLAWMVIHRDELVALSNVWVLGTSSTSTTSLAFGTGAKTLTVEPDKGYVEGMDVVIASTASPGNRMIGTVTAYNVVTGVLVVNVYSSVGSGTPAAWSVSATAAIDTSQFVLPNTVQTLTNKTINLASNTLIATSAQLAASIADESGTGALLFANSPAMTGTPTAPTPAAGSDDDKIATTAFVQNLSASRRRFTAQGAIGAGKTVVLNSNGTVSTVGYAINPGAVGPEETPTISGSFVQLLDIPGTDKVVMLTTTHLHVGTVNGGTGTTTWGTGTALPTGSLNRICWHPVENVVCMVFFNAAALYMQLGTISGSTISLGTAQSLSTAAAPNTLARYDLCYNAHQNKIVVVYTVSFTSAIAVHVAGGVMTAGTALRIDSGTASASSVKYAIASTTGGPVMVVSYCTSTSTQAVRALSLNALVLTASAETTVSGSLHATAWMQYNGAANRFVLVSGATNNGTVQLISLSGTTVTSTSPSASWGGTLMTQQQPMAYDIVKGKMVFGVLETSTNYAMSIGTTIVGNSLVLDTPIYINTSASSELVTGYQSAQDKALHAYLDAGNLNAKTTRVYDTGDSVTNANDWIGIANAAIANGQQGLVITKGGVASGLSGLTTGYTYYIDDLGELQQTGSRRAGVALSATELFLTGNM